MRLAFTPLAEQDLEAIADYIAADNPVRTVTTSSSSNPILMRC